MKAALILAIVVALGLGGSTVYFRVRDTGARHRADSLAVVADSLATEAGALQARNTTLAATLDTQVAAASRQKQAEIEQLRSTYDELVKDMQGEIAQGQIQITRLADRLNVSMVDKILFPSGEAGITPAGLRVLRRVGNVLKTTQGKTIRVEGHTDTVTISPRLKATFPTNWELSTARASNVVRFLQDSVGIAPERLQAIGLAQYHPIASNATARGRSQNRRIEIVLIPAEPRQP
ncbi:MAG TPA: OmpA family protein [Gemmatimonadales bacterium]|nr:OmpA family protein [Gemmatimonadales bacterium]